MTKKAKLRIKRPVELPPKQSGYCEICRVDYAHLPDHERSAAHLSFVKNCSNFLALDSLISGSADVEAFLKMNKSAAVNNSFERRSLRNIIKLHQEDGQEPRKQLEIVCNGSSDSLPKHASPRDRRHTPQMSPALSEGKHYLRSKGGDIPCKASPGEPFGNGSVSPRLNYDKTDTNKLNGKLEEKESRQFSPVQKGKKCRSIRWRQPSPDSTPIQPETQAYYKVVGMSTKLRSSTSFAPAPPPSHRSCNGDTGTGLVVKFRRVRRSELSVLSDEAENFMFPKKDDSDTEDEVETTLSSHKRPPTDMASESSDTHPLKEEVLSGDDGSQDSCSSDFVRRNPRRRTHVESYKDNIDYFGFDIAPVRQRRRASGSPNPQHWEVEVQGAKEENTEVKDKCLKWVDGRLRASERVEGLEYTFEQVPRCEPWYEAFSRQDEGKENTRSIIRYLNTFVKPPVLPYEMGELPPLKPNCCSLSQVRKPPEPKSGPSRPYGTRGMKKRKIKQDPVFALGLNPRKSPREHASTLAILGGLHHGKRSKFSGSEDSKSLPSIAEEETSSDAGPLIVKLPPNPALEATKQVEAFLTSVDEDDEDFEISLESVKFEKTSVKPNVIELIQNYQDCLIMENTVKEINENAHPEPPKRRKGYKFKKKNKTGWPNKRKTLKKDTASTIGSVCSSRDASANREAIDTVCRLDVDASIAECASQPESAPRKNSYQLELNENSITSTSDAEDNASISSKCKATDTEHSEDDNFVCTDAVDWQCKIKDARVRNRNSLDLQPVVRVLKMEEATARRLRSAAAGRRLRTRRRPHR